MREAQIAVGRADDFGGTTTLESRPNISVVVPVYNSENSLTELTFRLESVLAQVASAFEIVLVNDGSRDRSSAVISDLAERHYSVRAIELTRNYGQHNALLCGIREAQYELTVTLDDDLQHPPEEIPKLLDKLEENYDVVYGTPTTEQHDLLRVIASRITKIALQYSMGADTATTVSAFRVFRTDLRNAFSEYRGPFVSIDVLLTWGTRRFTSVPVRHEVRRVGTSNYTVAKLLIHAANMITGFSTVPLRAATIVGFAATLFGVAVLLLVLVRYILEGGSVPGFPFLASIIAIFSGAQLFALGMIGEYLARMHFRIMDRPAYVIRRKRTHSHAATENAKIQL